MRLDVIADFTRQVFPGATVDGSVTYHVDHIRFITPGLALTGVNQEYTDVTGEPLDPRSLGRPTYIWMRSGALADRGRTEHDLDRRPVISFATTHASAAISSCLRVRT